MKIPKTVNFEPDQFTWIEAKRKEQDVSANEIIREAITLYRELYPLKTESKDKRK